MEIGDYSTKDEKNAKKIAKEVFSCARGWRKLLTCL